MVYFGYKSIKIAHFYAVKHIIRYCINENYFRTDFFCGKLFCGYCESAITAEAGTSKTGRVYHYYKCYGKKLKTTDCHKKPVSQDFIETIVFEATIKYVLRPKVIDKIAEKLNILMDNWENSNY